MLNVDKEELKEKFIKEDWDYVFDKAAHISDFIISRTFKIYDLHMKEDIKQECLVNFWTKVQAGKCDPERNVFAFIWQNSTYRILEILRKENNRKRIARFMPFESEDYITFQKEIGEKYVPAHLQEVWV